MIRSIISSPLPVIAAAALLVEDTAPASVQGPQWFMGAVTAIFVMLWLLNAIGKLPGATTKTSAVVTLSEHDRQLLTGSSEQLHEIHRIITREDPEKPGWPMVWRATKEMKEAHAALISLSELKDVWLEDRERASAERTQSAEERRRLERRIEHLEKLVNGRDV